MMAQGDDNKVRQSRGTDFVELLAGGNRAGMMAKSRGGFALVELLLVVVIVAILCAIAVPQFRESSERSRVARVKSDMRTIAVALESYAVNWGGMVPFDGYQAANTAAYNSWYLPPQISTPVAYLPSNVFPDPYVVGPAVVGSNYQANNYRYTNMNSTFNTTFGALQSPARSSGCYDGMTAKYGRYRILSVGPDRVMNVWIACGSVFEVQTPAIMMPYDATNGTFSPGDIFRTQKCEEGYGCVPGDFP